MAKMTITAIENKTVQSNGNPYKSISVTMTSSDGLVSAKRFAVFGDNANMAVVGGVYDVTLKAPNARGQQNIDTMTLVSNPAPQATQAVKTGGIEPTGYNIEIGQKIKNDSITLQVAIKEIGECIRTKGVVVPETASEGYWAWIDKMVNPPQKTMVETAKELGAVAKGISPEVTPDDNLFPDDETIPDVGTLLTICLNDYAMGRLAVSQMLGQDVGDVKDFTGAMAHIRTQMNIKAEATKPGMF